MKNTISLIILLAIFLGSSCKKDVPQPSEEFLKKYIDIEDHFSLDDFEKVKEFILDSGDRKTYSAMYSNNPHYLFSEFEVYLNPEGGQINAKCDPTISDFNEIFIRDLKSIEKKHYHILVVRAGDINVKHLFYTVPVGMEEEKVYLLNSNDEDVNVIKNQALVLIEKIKEIVLDN